MISPKYKKQQVFKMVLMSLAVLFFDQIGKFFAINKFDGFYLYKNYDIFFGIPFIFHLFFLFLLFLFILLKKDFIVKSDNAVVISFSLLIGGIMSNTFDRTVYGFVIDYLIFFDIFVFNLADLSIFFGSLILSWKIFHK